jgi:galactokinase
MAIDRSTHVTARPRADRIVTVRSEGFEGTATLDLDNPREGPTGHWSDYAAGVVAVLARTMPLVGADLEIRSDVPAGAGLSSSAAVEVACGYALLDLAGAAIDRTALALACQRAEHEFAGTRCGIMDQFTACYGRARHALSIDTRTLQCAWIALPETVRVLVCHTMVSHHLATDEYNRRREDCEAGVRQLRKHDAHITALRDVSAPQLQQAIDELPARVFRRCRHVITENVRVQDAAAALQSGDVTRLGWLMRESHRSLRDDYEVSCAELDTMVTIASETDGVHGARMTGGGFGGCVVAIVSRDAVDRAAEQIAERYKADTGLTPLVWTCEAADGASRQAVVEK